MRNPANGHIVMMSCPVNGPAYYAAMHSGRDMSNMRRSNQHSTVKTNLAAHSLQKDKKKGEKKSKKPSCPRLLTGQIALSHDMGPDIYVVRIAQAVSYRNKFLPIFMGQTPLGLSARGPPRSV